MSELSKRIAELSPEKRALFVQRLSSIISSEEAQNRDEQATTTGSVPLTQNARWFFGLNLPAPHHWNLASLSTVQQDLDPTLVRQVLQHLLVYHDALRLRFKSIEHDWLSFIAPPDTVVPFTWIDLSEKNESEQRHNIEETATKLQASLNLEEGPLFKVALFNLGPQGPNRLLFIVHHLLADLYSLDILREDFSNAYQQLSQGKSIQQPLRTTSFKRWAERLAKYSQSGDLQQELDYWLTLPWAEIAPLPLDYPAQLHEFPLSSSTRRISIQLSSAETRALMQKRGVGTNSTHNLLLTAVVMAVGQWLDSDVIGVTIVHHGRDIDCDGIDLSRTVGWFAGAFFLPIRLDKSRDVHDVLQCVSEQYHSIHHHRHSANILLNITRDEELRQRILPCLRNHIHFNFSPSTSTSLGQWTPSPEFAGPTNSPLNPQVETERLRFITEFAGDKLHLTWIYNEKEFRQETINDVARNVYMLA